MFNAIIEVEAENEWDAKQTAIENIDFDMCHAELFDVKVKLLNTD